MVTQTTGNPTVYSTDFVPANNTANTKVPHHRPFARGIQRKSVDSPHKGPEIRKLSPFHDVIMHWNDIAQQLLQSLPSHATYNSHKAIRKLSMDWMQHDDVIKWKQLPRYWPFVRGIHRSPVKSPHKGQWRGTLMFSLICVWINDWVNNREAGDLRRYRAHYDVIVMDYEWHMWWYKHAKHQLSHEI